MTDQFLLEAYSHRFLPKTVVQAHNTSLQAAERRNQSSLKSDNEFRAQDHQQELLERRHHLRTYQQKQEEFRRWVEQYRVDVAIYN
jgi:hypothetical protein